jgi:hypothetical protein
VEVEDPEAGGVKAGDLAAVDVEDQHLLVQVPHSWHNPEVVGAQLGVSS